MTVSAGDRVALTGASGAGKSLLLRSLALLDPVDSGEIRFQGRVVADAEIPKFRSQVMYLGQRSAFVEGTVEENLRAPFLLKTHADQSFNAKRILGWLEQLGRDETFLKQRHSQLSGGEAQIVSMLRALQLDPLVLLADEPTSAMDAQTASAAEELVLRWLMETTGSSSESQLNRALVWVSHDTAQAQRLATRTVSINGGQVEDSSKQAAVNPDE